MSIELSNQIIFIGAILALLSIVASVLSRRLGAPLLLVFLVLGMLAGEDGPGGINFNDSGLAFLFGNLALAIIIYDGGLGARKDSFRTSLRPALVLATLGVIITCVITGLAASWVLGLSWQEGLLIGAIVGSTDAAAVFGLLKSAGLELKERTGATLEIESGTNDPMAIFLTVTLVQILVTGKDNVGAALIVELLQQMGLGLLIGIAGGRMLSLLLKKVNLALSLYPLLALAGGMSIFGLTVQLGGSGFLAIYIVGVMVGNSSLPYGQDIHRFHDGIAWLSQIGMFLMLGLLITPTHLPPIILPAIAIAAVLIFVARPLAVLVSLAPFRFPWREQVFVSWCGLRGAVPIILAVFPSLAGLENTQIYFELVFFVVLISLVVQGWTIAPVGRWLKVELPFSPKEPRHLALRIPNDLEKEILVYHVVRGSQAIGRKIRSLPLVEGAECMGVIRKGVILDDVPASKLEAEDMVVILGSAAVLKPLNTFFAPVARSAGKDASLFFGEFSINPDVGLSDLAALYGFKVEDNQSEMTVAELFVKQFHGKAVIGDRIELGAIVLVVMELEEGRIKSVGLKIK